ncbi:SUKH-3 domain-containing protein [Kitasatospora sp. NPDC088391]|uniref:SUKH-3 domain-containing protein n=1 Tax=Kitasatospora sp. NPDC088391 TaxID=3364074 RepID=UPI0037F2F94B
MISPGEWERVRSGLRLGQRMVGRVAKVPTPGATGIFVELGLDVGGFVDVLLLPVDVGRWPSVGTVAEFELWWAGLRPQIRLKPVDPRHLREDFATWAAEARPHWPEDVPVDEAWVDAAATALRAAGEVDRTLAAAGWHPGRQVPVRRWRELLEASGHLRMHAAAARFLAEFGGLEVGHGGPGVNVARTAFHLDPELAVGEEERFADWSERLGRDLFPIGELDHGRFFLAVDATGEICLVETWVESYGPFRQGLEKLVLGIKGRRLDRT